MQQESMETQRQVAMLSGSTYAHALMKGASLVFPVPSIWVRQFTFPEVLLNLPKTMVGYVIGCCLKLVAEELILKCC